MSGITYVVGDATNPAGDGPRVIAHVANDAGKWGAGFSGAISKRWRQPEKDYRAWFRESRREPDAAWAFGLGRNWTTRLDGGLYVTSMVAQHGIRSATNPKPIRYEALAECLSLLAIFARWHRALVHMPRIGCGLAGGTWDRMEPLIIEHLCERGVPVTVYDLP